MERIVRGPIFQICMFLSVSLIATMEPTPAASNEANFVYVSKMPQIKGELGQRTARQDSETRIRFTREIYRYEWNTYQIATFVLFAACPAEPSNQSEPFIMALKYLPITPKSFSIATLHDIYKEVYVRDIDNKVRAYENLGARELGDLTKKFSPNCPII
jgi:hypothetical protein